MFGIFTQLWQAVASILFSGNAIQLAITNPQLINVDSDFVKIGLTITTSLANILLVAAFIAIAIGYVFKVETFNSQKSLIKFFVIALLINFGPLFVRMIIDIANIATSSVLVGGNTIILDTCNQMAREITLTAKPLLLKFSIEALAAGIPLLGVAKGTAQIVSLLGTGIGGGWFLATLPDILIKIMIADIFAGLMFSYAIFFLTRIFMLQLLAVLSPLAILAKALPQTEKHFSTWWEWLIGWATAGILTLFLLTLGFSTIKTIQPYLMDKSIALNSGVSVFLGQNNLYWLMLCVYMLCVSAIVAATIPAVSGEIEKKIKESVSSIKKMTPKAQKEKKEKSKEA
ncbi:MAG: hypothetical protein MUD10_00125 [Candidatus Pacebacteria bacterium]|nr:hypothetical protein [Candidatus Paceibacterota bacterium]